MVILKSKIRSLVLPQLLLIFSLLMRIIINSWYNYYIIFVIKASSINEKSKKMWGNWYCRFFLFEKRILKLIFPCHVFVQSPPGQGTNDKHPTTLRTAPDLCKSVHSQYVLCGNNGNSYATFMQSDIYIEAHVLHNINRRWSGKHK
jgi:hypothetical protein